MRTERAVLHLSPRGFAYINHFANQPLPILASLPFKTWKNRWNLAEVVSMTMWWLKASAEQKASERTRRALPKEPSPTYQAMQGRLTCVQIMFPRLTSPPASLETSKNQVCQVTINMDWELARFERLVCIISLRRDRFRMQLPIRCNCRNCQFFSNDAIICLQSVREQPVRSGRSLLGHPKTFCEDVAIVPWTYARQHYKFTDRHPHSKHVRTSVTLDSRKLRRLNRETSRTRDSRNNVASKSEVRCEKQSGLWQLQGLCPS